MGGGWLARRNVGDFNAIDDWMAWRNADVAQRSDAEAAGREAWEQATRNGQDLTAAQPSDLVAIGAGLLNQGDPETSAPDMAQAAPAFDDPAQPGPSPWSASASPNAASASYGIAIAKPGDSISGLLGTSNPAALGRFASLNGLDGGNSTLYAGRSYAVPTRFDDASPGEVALGSHLLRRDNVRLAAMAAQPANDAGTTDRFETLINAGINPWTGEYSARKPSVESSNRPPAATTWLDRSQPAKALAGEAALRAGQAAGLVRGGWHLAQDAGVAFRLLNPLDPYFSAPGDAAWDHVIDAGGRIVGYAKKAISNPGAIADDVGNLARREDIELNPDATPMANTFPGELRRTFHIGANQGQAAFDVGSLFLGGEFAKELSLTRAVEAADAAKYAELGLDPKVIDYLNMPYERPGHHNIPQRFRFPKAVGGIPLPSQIAGQPLPELVSDSAFNLSKPDGITRGQMYAYHYRVDPKYFGGRLPNGSGGGWSGKKLGLRKYGPAERAWFSAPDALRAPVGNAVAGAAAADILQNDWDRP
jgi:hypothetical protein